MTDRELVHVYSMHMLLIACGIYIGTEVFR